MSAYYDLSRWGLLSGFSSMFESLAEDEVVDYEFDPVEADIVIVSSEPKGCDAAAETAKLRGRIIVSLEGDDAEEG
jgi:hypothetical protein